MFTEYIFMICPINLKLPESVRRCLMTQHCRLFGRNVSQQHVTPIFMKDSSVPLSTGRLALPASTRFLDLKNKAIVFFTS